VKQQDAGDGWMVWALLIGVVFGAAIYFQSAVQRAAWILVRVEVATLRVVSPVLPSSAQSWLDVLDARFRGEPPATANYERIGTILDVGGRLVRWPIGVVLIGFGVWVIVRSPVVRYRRTFDYESLLREQARTFVRMRPTLWLQGRMKPEDRGNYTRSLSPYEWAVSVGAIRAGERDAVAQSWAEGAARTAFAAQLGRQLPDDVRSAVDRMDVHERILFAVFAARIMDRKAESDALLDAVSIGFGPAGWSAARRVWQRLRGRLYYDWPATGPWRIALTRTDEATLAAALANAAKDTAVKAMLQQHAYVRPLLAAMLQRAQDIHGILTSGDFRWLKAVDRALHYALNDVGRRVASAEAAGVRAHLLAERTAGVRLHDPHVDAAVTALRQDMEETGWEAPPLATVAILESAMSDDPGREGSEEGSESQRPDDEQPDDGAASGR